ncbi:MAG: riboflavin synthase [Kiritimatiellae bacterium]|nr:riboflavin synthase [Kiritimatiellia bacterium]
MFTGLVQQMGTIKQMSRIAGGWSLEITCDPWSDPLELGESIAVQGACLTVTGLTESSFTADILDETMLRTALQELGQGARVNLERALMLGARLGGHLVSGHIDETGVIAAIENRGRDIVLRVGCTPYLARYSVMKGSITIDGVSLTISGLGDDWIEVNVIPYTWEITTLSSRQINDRVNLEGDIIGKYIARLMGKEPANGITEQMLQDHGFA